MPKDEKIKSGLWEDGKRIEWFNETQVSAINSNQLDYSSFFHQTDSERMVEPHAKFRKPNFFDERLSDVKRKIAKLNVKVQTNNSSPLGGGLTQS